MVNLAADYGVALAKIRHGQAAGVLLVGERAVLSEDIDDQFISGLRAAKVSIGMISSSSPLAANLNVTLPSRVILEKSGLLINRKGRLQYTQRVIEPPKGSAEWRILLRVANLFGHKLVEPESERDLSLRFLEEQAGLKNYSLRTIKNMGVQLQGES